MQSRLPTRYVHPYNDVIMGAMPSQITSLTIVYSTVHSGAQRKHQSVASLTFVWGIHRWPVNSPHKWPVTRKMFPFDDVIMDSLEVLGLCFITDTIYILGFHNPDMLRALWCDFECAACAHSVHSSLRDVKYHRGWLNFYSIAVKSV